MLTLRTAGLAALLALTAAMAAACGGSGGGDTASPVAAVETPALVTAGVPRTPTPMPPPTDIPSPGPQHGSTPAPAEATPIPPDRLDPAALSVPVCNTLSPDSPFTAFGTVPAPTPVPTPTPAIAPTPRSRETVRSEVSDYLAFLQRVVDAAALITGETEQGWRRSEDVSERAALVFVESRRIGALCSALSLSTVPPEASDAGNLAAGLLARRQQWAAGTASLVRASGQIAAPELDAARARAAPDIAAARAVFQTIESQFQITTPRDPPDGRIDNEAARVALVAPPGWFLVRSNSQIVLAAPPDLQAPGIRGLGSGRQGYGTSIRIRRARNAPGWTLADAEGQVGPLLESFGQQTGVESVEVDGSPGTAHHIVNGETSWNTTFVVVVAGDFSFFFEMGCPAEFSDECGDALDGVLSSSTFLGT